MKLNLKKQFVDVLKGRFLTNDGSGKNWRFIVFAGLLALVMIASSHNAEGKVHLLSDLDKKVKELRSEHVDLRSQLMQLKIESSVARKVAGSGLKSSEEPPKKIKVIAE